MHCWPTWPCFFTFHYSAKHRRYHCLNCNPEQVANGYKAVLWSTGGDKHYEEFLFRPRQTRMAIRPTNLRCILGERQCGCNKTRKATTNLRLVKSRQGVTLPIKAEPDMFHYVSFPFKTIEYL